MRQRGDIRYRSFREADQGIDGRIYFHAEPALPLPLPLETSAVSEAAP
jgi:hypothetical protein